MTITVVYKKFNGDSVRIMIELLEMNKLASIYFNRNISASFIIYVHGRTNLDLHRKPIMALVQLTSRHQAS